MSKYTMRPIEGLSRVAVLWLMISAVTDGYFLIWSIIDVWVLSNAASLPPAFLKFWDISALLGLGQMLVLIICVVIVGRWIYRACANVHAMGKSIETSPPWAVGWYFIPFANLWMPYKAMREIWQASVPSDLRRRSDHDRLLPFWWAAWLIGNIVGNIAFRINLANPGAEGLIAASVLTAISCAASITAALVLRRIIQAVTRGQSGQSVADVF